MCPTDLNQPVNPSYLPCLYEETASVAIQNAPSEDSDQTAQMQSDLNLLWTHISEGMFSLVGACM